jgi:phosphopantetheine--protein transferase-like protein
MKRIARDPRTLLGSDIAAVRRILDWNKPDFKKFNAFARKLLISSDLGDFKERFGMLEDVHKSSSNLHESLAFWLAGRLAVKEAAKKAWGPNIVTWSDLRVEHDKYARATGRPPVLVINPFKRDDPKGVEQEASCSISHDGEYAHAVVIAEPLHPTILTELLRRRAEVKAAQAQRKKEEAKKAVEDGKDSGKGEDESLAEGTAQDAEDLTAEEPSDPEQTATKG